MFKIDKIVCVVSVLFTFPVFPALDKTLALYLSASISLSVPQSYGLWLFAFFGVFQALLPLLFSRCYCDHYCSVHVVIVAFNGSCFSRR